MVATPTPKPQMKRERQMATKKTTSKKKTAKATSAKAKATKAKKPSAQKVEVAPAEAKAKKHREPKVASEQAEKKLSQFQAAIKVLAEAKEPMSCKQMVEVMQATSISVLEWGPDEGCAQAPTIPMGFCLVHSPRVKSGTAIGALPLPTDSTLNGKMLLQAAAS
jgi:hypothetical protein